MERFTFVPTVICIVWERKIRSGKFFKHTCTFVSLVLKCFVAAFAGLGEGFVGEGGSHWLLLKISNGGLIFDEGC